MQKETITSNDVARLAKVSQSAVSRTFTAGASVSKKTRKKVLAAAKTLGYRPNALARSLISGRSMMVGLVVAYLENHFYPLVIESLSRRLQEQGYQVLLIMTDPGQRDEVIHKVLQYQVDSVVLASVTLSSHIADECAQLGVPVVLINRYIPDATVSSVASDNVYGGMQIADYLASTGHTRIAYIAGQEDSSTNMDREKGFKKGLRKHKLKLFDRQVGHYTFEGAQAAARVMMSKKQLPDAIFVANDHMAFAVMDVIRSEFKLTIPDDISIVGFDNVPEAGWIAYSLTTVEQPIETMVAQTAQMLIDQMKHNQVSPERKVLKTQLVIRGSVRERNV